MIAHGEPWEIVHEPISIGNALMIVSC